MTNTSLESINYSEILQIDIDRTQLTRLKQLFKQFSTLDYDTLGRDRQNEFRTYLVKRLVEINDEVTRKRQNMEVVDLGTPYEEIVKMLEDEINFVKSISDIQEQLSGIAGNKKSKPNTIPKRESY